MFERETIADVCVGVVLAAGGGRRMAAAHGSAQGTAKPFVRVAGRRLIDYSIAALQAEVSTVIVNINQCDAEVFDLPVVPDLPGHSVGPLGGVVSALLTGEQTAVDKDVAQAMRDSGLAHILSISGLHIVFVVGLVMGLGAA